MAPADDRLADRVANLRTLFGLRPTEDDLLADRIAFAQHQERQKELDGSDKLMARSTEDLTPIEGEFVAKVRAITRRNRDIVDRNFADALNIETQERRRQIQNARALGNLNKTAEDPTKWR